MNSGLKFTDKEMIAAQNLIDGKSQTQAAKEAGMNLRTLQRRMAEPRFLAYMDEIRSRHDKTLSAPTEKKLRALGASFVKADGLEFYLEMAYDKLMHPQYRLAAMKEAMATAGYDCDRVPDNPEGRESAKPNIYKPAWMQ